MKTSRLLFLGAGFSRPAGLPLGSELFHQVRARIASQHGRDNHVERDLKRYIDYMRNCFNRDIPPEEVDYEQFLGFLDVEHYLGLKGKDTWSSEGNESQLMIRGAIAQVVHSHTPSDVPDAYRCFARQLNTSDYVLTFNYDTLLEKALDLEGVRYRLFPEQYSKVDWVSCTIDPTAPDELVLIKLHGSIDWFSREPFDTMVEFIRATPNAYPAGHSYSHPLFGDDAIVTPVSLTRGPRPEDESLRHLYRVRDVTPILTQPFWKCTPFILVPSTLKLLYAAPVLEFWRGLQRSGGLNLSLGIIGYSLPKYDDYALQAIYHVARNYLHVEPDLSVDGRRKTKVRIIDYRKTDEQALQLRERYRFLDWGRTETWLDGFSEEAAEWMLR